jgi:hypothetical protein
VRLLHPYGIAFNARAGVASIISDAFDDRIEVAW